MTVDRCIEARELDALLDLEPGDPRLEHVAECPRCRALVASYRRFIDPGPAPLEARAGEADAELDAFRARLLGTSAPAMPGATGADASREDAPAPPGSAPAAPRVPRRGTARSGWGPLGPVPVSAWAAAGLMVVAGAAALWFTLAERRGATVLRGERAAALTLSAPAPDPGGRVRLAWRGHPEAERYEVVFYGADLVEVARLDAGADTTLSIDPAALPPAAGPQVLYRVEARRGGDPVGISGTGAFARP